ncbi:hypothetical protein OESDEN_00892 [Oesophagostomum dentatum]|uniref:Amino acid permease/ SLC12A domain-containing protein n=1 Tax=Oesophagostomum dentatum TaxID=61180 RepID=A0A0B1TPH2_OESDE|nr:hypothetical protein OESDEN_00892 [Oesophagostomum dentatum]
MFSASRYLQAAAKQGHLPSFISAINPVTDSPRTALTVHILIAMLASFAGNLDKLISYVAFAQWSQRACTMIALIWIRFRHWPLHPEKIQMPIVMPVVFCFVCTAMVVITIIDDFSSAAVGLGIWVGGFIVYLLFIYDRALPSSKTYRRMASTFDSSTTRWAQIIFDVMPERGEDEERRDYAIGGGIDKVFTIDAQAKVFPSLTFTSIGEEDVKTKM